MSSFNSLRNNAAPTTSFAEQLIYWTIAAYFYNTYKVYLHYKLDTYEFDIAIPELNTLIECQSRLHVNSTKMDKIKQDYCKSNNIKLITVMNWQDSSKIKVNYQTDYIEVGCPGVNIRDSIEKVLLPDNKLDFNKVKLQKNEHSRYIAATYALLMLIIDKKVDIEHFCKLPWHQIWQTSLNKSVDATLPFEKSLASRPDLLKEFRGLVKYDYISPREISLCSNEYANWECGTCGHKWQADVKNRVVLNNGCPKCGYTKSSIAHSTCKDIQKSFYTKYKLLVPFIKANSIQEKEDLAKKLYASSHKQLTLICPHCQKERIVVPHSLQGAANIKCKECNRWFIE